jgi:hypothetical protein
MNEHLRCLMCKDGWPRVNVGGRWKHEAPAPVLFFCDQQSARNGDWIQTFTGRQFWPLDPRPEELDIEDIAVALSRDCRYAGHCKRFFTVAEHSVHMTRVARSNGYNKRDQRTALLHDASEAYLRDIPRPLKRWLRGYREIEARLMEAIAERFEIDWPIPPYIKALDEAIGLDEVEQNMLPPPEAWARNFHSTKPLGVQLQYWPPDEAFKHFAAELQLVGLSI